MKTAICIKPGIFTTVQDLGRIGMRRYGIGYAGVADVASAVNANILCGNPPGAALLECTYQGPVIKFYGSTSISVTGRDVEIFINEKTVDEKAHQVTEGDVLKLRINNGCRAYIAFRGGIDGPSIQGSRATDTVSRCCGYTIKEGAIIYTLESKAIETHALLHPPDYGKGILEAFPGPEYHLLDASDREVLVNHEWIVSSRSSRMSYMLEGTPLGIGYQNMLSGPVLPGTIQIPPSGLPIILGNDSQTTGGYPRIGILIPQSYQILSQKPPGSTIRLSILEE
jgi:biotin-dependent carboxylase-like uncharacterized protein